MMLNAAEIRIILGALRDKYGPGYCMESIEVGRLQAKLSIMLEATLRSQPTR